MADYIHTRLYKVVDGVKSLAYPETCGDQVVLNDGSTLEEFRVDVEERLSNTGSSYAPVRMETSGPFTTGESLTVPPYKVGSGNLEVYVGGLLCSSGTDAESDTYTEVGTTGEESTSITWLDNISSKYDVVILVR